MSDMDTNPPVETPKVTDSALGQLGVTHSTADAFNTRPGTDAAPNTQDVAKVPTKDIPYTMITSPPIVLPDIGKEPVTMTSSMKRKY